MRWIRASWVALMACSLTLGPAAFGAGDSPPCTKGCVTGFVLPFRKAQPFGIAKGPLGSEWFSMNTSIARIDRRGTLTVYPVPWLTGDNGGGDMGWVTVDPHGSVWFTSRDGGGIGRITADGTLTRFRLREPSSTQGLVVAPNGKVWFTDQIANVIGRIDPATHQVHEFPVPSGGSPVGLAMGPDGNLWFTEPFIPSAAVGRMTPDGHFTLFPLAAGSVPFRIASGPDGAVWFTELGANKLGRITTGGTLTEYRLKGGPLGITPGPGGRMYVSLYAAHALAQVNLHGEVLRTWHLTGASSAFQVAPGVDGTVWVTDDNGGRVYRVTPDASTTS